MSQKPRWYKNLGIWIVIAIIIAVLFIPKLIDYLYLIGSDKVNTTFKSKDILSFWGALLGGVATLFGVIITVKHSEKNVREERKQAEEERKRQIKPSLASSYKHVYHDNFVDQKEENEGGYIIIAPKRNDDYHIYYSPIPPTWLKYERSKDNTTNMLLSLHYMKKYLCIEYRLENVGNDTACEIKLRIDGTPATTDFALAKMNSKIFKLIFVLEDFNVGEEKDIEFTYDFLNIDRTVEYRARESFTVFKDLDDSLSSKQHPNDFLKMI